MLDLLLFGLSIADDRRLDGERRVFGDLETRGGGGKHGDAAHLSQLQCGFHVDCVKDVFNRHLLGTVLEDQFFEASVNAIQTQRQRLTWREFDGTAANACELSRRSEVDYAVAGVFRATVDPENPHGGKCTVVCVAPDSSIRVTADGEPLTAKGADGTKNSGATSKLVGRLGVEP